MSVVTVAVALVLVILVADSQLCARRHTTGQEGQEGKDHVHQAPLLPVQ
jgi:hypothetical protein